MKKNYIGDKLNKARDYENINAKGIKSEERPYFHLSSPIGWINDPNGFSLYKDEYHLFYQYHPYSTQWGPMYWGHVITKDFIKWEQKKIALAPENSYDKDGCFSGTAIEVDGKHIIAYTRVIDNQLEDGRHLICQTQSIAVGDGEDYEKLDCNPVITKKHLPNGASSVDFRDPKIWMEDDTYYMLTANRSQDGSGQLILFDSKDLKEWSLGAVIEKCNNEYGKMWECPDFFMLDNESLILLSPQEMEAKGLEIHSGNGSIYLKGQYNKIEKKFERNSVGVIDYGLDFYAPQTCLAKDGRRIMIAWMQSWDNYITPTHFKWSGIMTLPRELSLINGKLYQKPVREIENYWEKEVNYRNITLKGTSQLNGINGRELDLEVNILEGIYSEFEIRFAKKDDKYISLSYEPKKNKVKFDRKFSSQRKDVISQREILVDDKNGNIKFRIIIDKYSMELFVNDGEQVVTCLYYCELSAKEIEFIVEGEATCHIRGCHLKVK